MTRGKTTGRINPDGDDSSNNRIGPTELLVGTLQPGQDKIFKERANLCQLPEGPRYHHVPVFVDSDYSPDILAKCFTEYSSEDRGK